MLLDALREEFTRSDGLPYIVILVRVIGAALLSAVIGLERELYKNSAGLRTRALVNRIGWQCGRRITDGGFEAAGIRGRV